jgi:hypothetical protein
MFDGALELGFEPRFYVGPLRIENAEKPMLDSQLWFAFRDQE